MASGDHVDYLYSAAQGDDGPELINQSTEATARYLDELVKDARQLDQMLQNARNIQLLHARQILTREMERVWNVVKQQSANNIQYMDDQGTLVIDQPMNTVKIDEKVWVPVNKYPKYNFIGRVLGPRGMSVKQLEQETGCKILVRGQGSVKDPEREGRLMGKAGWEHLSEPLHILVSVQDIPDRAQIKLEQAVSAVKQMLHPSKNDDHKRRQLMELAIINGTYRPQEQRQNRNI